MNAYTVTDAHTSYKRVSKREARKLWKAGAENLSMCPVKLRPGYPWAPDMPMRPVSYLMDEVSYDGKTPDEAFNRYVADFEWYNCSNETGTYTAFYVRSSK